MKKIIKSTLLISAMALASVSLAQEMQTVKSEIKVFYNGLSYCVLLPANAASEVTVKDETMIAKSPKDSAKYIRKFRSSKAGGSFEVKDFVPAIGDDISIVLRNKEKKFIAEYYYIYLPVKSFTLAGVKLISINGVISVVGDNVTDVNAYDLQGRQVNPEAIQTSGVYIVKAKVNGESVQEKIFVDAR